MIKSEFVPSLNLTYINLGFCAIVLEENKAVLNSTYNESDNKIEELDIKLKSLPKSEDKGIDKRINDIAIRLDSINARFDLEMRFKNYRLN